MNPLIAMKINRPDVASFGGATSIGSGMPIDPYGGSSGIAQVGAGASGSIPGIFSADIQGRATAAVLIVALLAVAGFYVWTRGVQA